MRLHRGLAHEEALRDAPVAQAGRDEPRDLDLASRQHRSDLSPPRLPLEQDVERPGGRSTLEPELATMDCPQALQEQAWRRLLQYHAAHAEPPGLHHLMFVDRRRQ